MNRVPILSCAAIVLAVFLCYTEVEMDGDKMKNLLDCPSSPEGEVSVPQRHTDIDLVKTLGILGVLIIHTCSAGFSYPVASFDWTGTLIWAAPVRASVPLFFMCSGVLFLSPSRELPLKKLYLKNILRILLAMLFWSFLYKLYHLYTSGALSATAIFTAFKEILLFKQEFHFYYLHIILLFYILVPIVRVFTRAASKNELLYGLAVWFLVGILYPTLRPFWPFSLLDGIPSQWLLNMTYAAMGYGLLGYYIKEYGISVKVSVIFLLLSLAFIFGGSFFMSVRRGELYGDFMEGMSFGVAFLATGIFGLCVNCAPRCSRGFKSLCLYVSRASFCIYCVHVFFIYLLSGFGLSALTWTPIISVPVTAAVNMLLCCVVYSALSRIPLVKKWLI